MDSGDYEVPIIVVIDLAIPSLWIRPTYALAIIRGLSLAIPSLWIPSLIAFHSISALVSRNSFLMDSGPRSLRGAASAGISRNSFLMDSGGEGVSFALTFDDSQFLPYGF